MITGTSAAVYADFGSTDEGAGAAGVETCEQAARSAQSAAAQRGSFSALGARAGGCALQHLKATPQAERIGVQRPVQVGKVRVGAQGHARLGEGQERTDPPLDARGEVSAGDYGEVRLRRRAGYLRARDDRCQLRSCSHPADESP